MHSVIEKYAERGLRSLAVARQVLNCYTFISIAVVVVGESYSYDMSNLTGPFL